MDDEIASAALVDIREPLDAPLVQKVLSVGLLEIKSLHLTNIIYAQDTSVPSN